MKKGILFFCSVLFLGLSFNILAENKAYLKNGKIVVENEQGGRKIIDYENNKFIAISPSKNWVVKKDSSQGSYRKILITNANNHSDIVISYPSSASVGSFAFSPQEDVVFYNLQAGGNFQVYEVNLKTKERTLVTTSQSADILSCRHLSAVHKYILIKDKPAGANEAVYYLYSPQDSEVRAFGGYNELEFFKEHYCNN